MANSAISKFTPFDKNYYKIATYIFQKYAYINFEDLSLLKSFQIDFEYWTKEN